MLQLCANLRSVKKNTQKDLKKGLQLCNIDNIENGYLCGTVGNRAEWILNRRRNEESMSNRLFQGVIHQMRDSIDRTIGVIDESSVIIACSELGKIGEVIESVTTDDIQTQAAFFFR